MMLSASSVRRGDLEKQVKEEMVQEYQFVKNATVDVKSNHNRIKVSLNYVCDASWCTLQENAVCDICEPILNAVTGNVMSEPRRIFVGNILFSSIPAVTVQLNRWSVRNEGIPPCCITILKQVFKEKMTRYNLLSITPQFLKFELQ